MLYAGIDLGTSPIYCTAIAPSAIAMRLILIVINNITTLATNK